MSSPTLQPSSGDESSTPTSSQELKLHELQKFTTETLDRRLLKNAEYNPRVMTAAERRKLREGLKALGLLEPLVWNRLSGNLVGGHQRISILDAIHGSPEYLLTVSVVELTGKQEIEANVLLNNQAAQGQTDLGKLEDLMRKHKLDLPAMGWDQADMYRLFGEGGTPGAAAEAPTSEEAKKEVEKAVERILELDKSTEDAKAAAVARDNGDFYMVVVFKTYEDRLAFTEALGLEDNRYQSGESLAGALSVTPAPPSE